MNSFPVIFARGRELSQMAKIRESFKSKASSTGPLTPYSSKIVLKPKVEKNLRLKRPVTAGAYRRSKNTETETSQELITPPSSQLVIPSKPADKKSRNGCYSTVKVGGRILRKINASPIPFAQAHTVLKLINLTTKEPRIHSSRTQTPILDQPNPMFPNHKTEKETKGISSESKAELSDTLSRSKSVETHRPDSVISNKESEIWTVSNTDGSPNPHLHIEDLSPFEDTSPVLQNPKRPRSPIHLEKGEAVMPNQLTFSHYFMKLFGAPLTQSDKRLALLSFLQATLGVTITAASHITLTHNQETEEMYVIITGSQAPLSPCCKAAVIFSFGKESGGKVLCTASYCPSRTIANFYIPFELRGKMWNVAFQRASISSRELSTHVRKGSYKTTSLRREIEKRCQTAATGRKPKEDELLMLSSKPIFTNEKLKYVTPSPVKPAAALRLPVDLQIDTLTPPSFRSHISSNPLFHLLDRMNSRHNTIRKHYTTDELLGHLSSLLRRD